MVYQPIKNGILFKKCKKTIDKINEILNKKYFSVTVIKPYYHVLPMNSFPSFIN